MHILLAQNLLHLPAFGGANKTNRVLVHRLAERGHTCRVVAPMAAGHWPASRPEFRRFLADRGLTVTHEPDEAIVYDDAGVEVHAVPESSRLPLYATGLCRRVAPDLALVTLGELSFIMVNAAFEGVGPDRVVCLLHTVDYLPFGPSAQAPSEAGTRQLRRAGGLLTVSRLAETYVREHGGLDSVMLRLPLHAIEPGPFPDAAPFPGAGDRAGGAVTLINPSGEKGIATFLYLADRLPGQDFLAVPTWATTAADRAALAARPNIRLMDPSEDIDDVLARTRVLVMPSVWAETFGMSAPEAMLRGIPVVASDRGGLPEAMAGAPYLLPADVPDRWLAVVSRLLSDAEHYRDVSARAREAATRLVAGARFEDVEAYLLDRIQASGRSSTGRAGEDVRARVDDLSPAQRRVLAAMLARRARTGGG
ncbi:MAG: glycosyltransferase [Actinoallomurus sp.]